VGGVVQPDNRKIFPCDYLSRNLTKKGLAYWYMDDGTTAWSTMYRNNCGIAKLLVYGYNNDERYAMQRLLKENFGLSSALYYRKDRDGYEHRFTTTEITKFFDLIKPYVVPSMLYKVDYEAYLEYRANKETLAQTKVG